MSSMLVVRREEGGSELELLLSPPFALLLGLLPTPTRIMLGRLRLAIASHPRLNSVACTRIQQLPRLSKRSTSKLIDLSTSSPSSTTSLPASSLPSTSSLPPLPNTPQTTSSRPKSSPSSPQAGGPLVKEDPSVFVHPSHPQPFNLLHDLEGARALRIRLTTGKDYVTSVRAFCIRRRSCQETGTRLNSNAFLPSSGWSSPSNKSSLQSRPRNNVPSKDGQRYHLCGSSKRSRRRSPWSHIHLHARRQVRCDSRDRRASLVSSRLFFLSLPFPSFPRVLTPLVSFPSLRMDRRYPILVWWNWWNLFRQQGSRPLACPLQIGRAHV